MRGVVGSIVHRLPDGVPFLRVVSGSGLGWPTEQGESPVHEGQVWGVGVYPSSSGLVESAVNLPGPPGKPKYSV